MTDISTSHGERMKRRVAILISGRGSNMAALIEGARAADFPAEIVLVLANTPDAAGLARARQAGIATEVIDSKPFGKDRAGFEAAMQTVLDANGIDLICLGGDLVDSRPAEVQLLDGFLRRLRAPLGVFGVLGNHEYYPARNVGEWIGFLEDRGVRVLINRGERVAFHGGSAWIAGVDDLTEGEPRIEAALRGRRWDEPTLLLSHHPDLFLEAATHDVDLQLSGHTHGGQIRIKGWQPLVHTRFGLHRGAFRHNGTHLYVGRGVGVTVAPVRIDAAPEVALVRWGGA